MSSKGTSTIFQLRGFYQRLSWRITDVIIDGGGDTTTEEAYPVIGEAEIGSAVIF